MSEHSEIKNIFTLIIFILVLNTAATIFSWYTLLPWFDMPMHFLGGVFLGLSLSYVFKKFKLVGENISLIKFSLLVILFTFIIGALWEGYEYIVQFYTHASLANPIDSLSDLFFDIVGGILATILYIISRRTDPSFGGKK